jgi:acetoin utilization deacetylase AcuC-like enzyme
MPDTQKRTGSLVQDERFKLHKGPPNHPEKPERLMAIETALKESSLLSGLATVTPRLATEEDLLLVHKESSVENIKRAVEYAREHNCVVDDLDGSTYLNAASYEIAKLAVGGAYAGVDSLNEDLAFSFALLRPPGHHAVPDSLMGFCLFNNIALAARYAQRTLGARRIFILDWDVHHGNGTQEIFYDDPSVFFLSTHQFPLYPGTGWYTEMGEGEGKGYTLNVPLPPGTGDGGYVKVWEQIIEPVFHEYQPDLIMLSAGYDAHVNDPLANQCVTTDGYRTMAQKLAALAASRNIKIFAALEGGYDTKALGESVVATIAALQGATESPDLQLSADQNPDEVKQRLADVRQQHASFWKSLR